MHRIPARTQETRRARAINDEKSLTRTPPGRSSSALRGHVHRNSPLTTQVAYATLLRSMVPSGPHLRPRTPKFFVRVTGFHLVPRPFRCPGMNESASDAIGVCRPRMLETMYASWRGFGCGGREGWSYECCLSIVDLKGDD
jgi:hypothetical protein